MSDTRACRHVWREEPAKTSDGSNRPITRCVNKCGAIRWDGRPVSPAGDLYFLTEVTPREEEDDDGPR